MSPFRSQSLNELLSQELTLGNRIVDDGPGWGSMKRLVILQNSFRTPLSTISANLSYREVNDPHYWKAEVIDSVTMEMLACRFE